MNTSFDKQAIMKIREKLISKSNQPETEEATKQWLILPLLVALGYDPYSSDIIPEYKSDVGIKKGEKVDYALQINNQPIAIVECKQLSVNLSKEHISQLYRYFSVLDIHIAILTNGDDYWFFTDSQKENVMDFKPYFTIKLSCASDDDIDKLNIYSKDLIQYTDMDKLIKYEKFQLECKDLAVGLRYNRIPTWLIDALVERSGGLADLSKSALAEYLYSEIQNTFKEYKIENINETDEQQKNIGIEIKDTVAENKKQVSNIKLNHEYTYNDYTDGDWKFHKLDYAIILGTRYDNISARQLLINTLLELIKQSKINIDIADEEQFNTMYKIGHGKGKNVRGAYYFEDYNIYISTSYGIGEIIKFIEKLLRYADVDDSNIKISFKA